MIKTEPGRAPVPADAVAGTEDAGPFRICNLVTSQLRPAATPYERRSASASKQFVSPQGRSDVDVEKGDWRFAHPTWSFVTQRPRSSSRRHRNHHRRHHSS